VGGLASRAYILPLCFTEMALLARFDGRRGGPSAPRSTTTGIDDSGDGPSCGAGGPEPDELRAVSAPLTCEKCKEAIAVCRVRGQANCRVCLQAQTQHRLHRGLTSSAGAGFNVLLAVSGGAASSAALHIAVKDLDCGRRRRAFLSLAAAHVDMSSLLPFFAHPHDPGCFSDARASIVRMCALQGLSTVVVFPESLFLEECAPAEVLAVVVGGASVCAPGPLRPQYQSPTVSEAAVTHAIVQLELQLARLREEPRTVQARQRMLALLSAAKTLDSRVRLYQALLERTLVLAAASLGFSHLALCDTTDRAAVKLLTGTCEGAGYSLPLLAGPVDVRFAAPRAVSAPPAEVRVCPDSGAAGSPDAATAPTTEAGGACSGMSVVTVDASLPSTLRVPFPWYDALPPEKSYDRRDFVASPVPEAARGGVAIFKPLLEVEAKEVALLCRYAGIPTVFVPELATMAPPRAAIAAAADALVTNLQATFVNTVHNVVRTIRKVEPPANTPRLPTDQDLFFSRPGSGTPEAFESAYAAARDTPWCALCGALLPAPGSLCGRIARDAVVRMGLIGGDAAPAVLSAADGAAAAEGRAASATDAPGARTGAAACSSVAALNRPTEALLRCFCHPCLLVLKDAQGSDEVAAATPTSARLTVLQRRAAELTQVLPTPTLDVLCRELTAGRSSALASSVRLSIAGTALPATASDNTAAQVAPETGAADGGRRTVVTRAAMREHLRGFLLEEDSEEEEEVEA